MAAQGVAEMEGSPEKCPTVLHSGRAALQQLHRVKSGHGPDRIHSGEQVTCTSNRGKGGEEKKKKKTPNPFLEEERTDRTWPRSRRKPRFPSYCADVLD